MDPVIIVGASHAAVELIASLRKLGWTHAITLIGDEPNLPYQRPPLSKTYLKGEIGADKLLIRPAAFYQNNHVDLHLGKRVMRINRADKTIELDDEESHAYSHLVLATGTRARELPVAGANLPAIHTLRTLEDVDQIKTSLVSGANLLVVGAGYIGLEVAASAIKQGINVVVLEALDRVLARVTSPTVSEFYQQLHEQERVDIRLNSTLTEFEQTDEGYRATTGQGEAIDFDLAIVGIGVVPNVELAETAGLACDNGIRVNEYAQTDDPCIYAVGDCSNHHNPFYDRWVRLESVPNAVEQAKVAAAHICGKGIIYDQLPWFWSDQYDVKLQTAGLFQRYDEIVVRGRTEDRKFAVFYLLQDRVIAVDAINSPAEFMVAKKLILAKTEIDKSKLADPEVPIKTLLATQLKS